MDEIILEMSNISKKFSGVEVLKNVNFSLTKGEVHILMGENGAGKSTLMKILTGVHSSDRGEIKLKNNKGKLEKVKFSNTREALDLGISMVFQELNLIESMSIAENIYLGREPTKKRIVDFKKMNKLAEIHLKKVSLNVDPGRIVSTLTVAEKQCVEIAKCISRNAKVIILDEPTSSLSKKEVFSLFQLIHNLKKQGISIIYISHRMEEIFKIGDRITVLRDGEYIATVNASETNQNELVRMMTGRRFKKKSQENTSHQGKEIMLECKNVSINKYSSKVNFKIYAGEIVGIFGLVGAGRTEFAKTLFGLDPIPDGTMYKHGKQVIIKNPSMAIRNKIGLIPEDRKLHGLNLKQDVRDNLSLVKLRDLSWVLPSRKKESKITKEYINKLSIVTSGQSQIVEFLSGGNQQKVVIAKWLAMDMDVLIMDEPTRGVDVGAKSEIYDIIYDLASKGKSIIMISSDLPEVLRVCHRIVVMHDGRITYDQVNEGLTEEIIMNAALG